MVYKHPATHLRTPRARQDLCRRAETGASLPLEMQDLHATSTDHYPREALANVTYFNGI